MCKTVLGTFNAERYWRKEKYAKLPEIKDRSSDNIVSAMDELLFPLCGGDDVLITRHGMSPVLKNYLDGIGFSFTCNYKGLQNEKDGPEKPHEKCVFELLNEQRGNSYFQALLNESSELNSYAVLPYTSTASRNWGMNDSDPEFEVVKEINSKVYSHELCGRIGIKKYGTVIHNSRELETAAGLFGSKRGFLIKDPYGVSGKGNLIVSSRRILKKIEKYIALQEEKGLSACFLIEPYLDKLLDFSCQMMIDREGHSKVLTIQNMFNQNFSYRGSAAAEEDFIKFLDGRGYFKIMNKAAVELAKDGYCGDVCIDSMLTKDNEIVPLVEINARKAMGLINYYIDKFLDRFSLKSRSIFFSTSFEGDIRFEDILIKMENEGILFKKNGPGIIPLSCRTLFINKELGCPADGGKTYKGRLYISAAAKNPEESERLLERAKEALRSLSFNIYH